MPFTFTQIFLSLFLLFAISRVVIRFREGILPLLGFAFWLAVFGFAIVIVLFPGLTSVLATVVGIGRGADFVIYVSVSLIFFLIFRLYIYLEDIRHDITEIITHLALENKKRKNARKTS
ncbi:hypothetical protein A3D05_04680 [Candidatus Gottesmanbacteria bacterium RIFCSPHIGHO2_02_FULL_40_24]|uniref:DUF2304 domain-containing protein n=1 Tax=Candidatus Gottesmanbacteria bacterium RIFCSPHIGHO2_01_FULL_40_15 TaxID=1798376 RepID=A0A1F5Z2P4_9BACT|nr:MAG: hypothetical protein A2777_05710 [Candidatus Gottesmanbacteria bacterium RIFCSPHIGHO2_01_FULL_40_15]OGG16166.1 MAG: hypothetical protein A3D05_04680 [Candidatus Gottesmanbacteria bacterium RIFCSPHIGHO2_02_FULL_40_24]OGG23142.1 MAG: hypothetical protein A3B48_04515 [Candidatus Gottesmanbacteria bacterium RIFCSPLOWO2_01_FULL_40_10]OGG25836.1 MAG: hypothetical protein A3E42_05950 [Candidatus Gottesmanbacteria bacterium RIFCSPHIGHO2_12_FULL_40_13]OGG33254.1 MAG: hypothetical protein A3I80_0